MQKNNIKSRRYSIPILLLFLTIGIKCFPVNAAETSSSGLNVDWGGRIKASGNRYYPDTDSIYHDADGGPYDDGSLDGRLTLSVLSESGMQFDLHYENVFSSGDLREVQNTLAHGGTASIANIGGRPDDDRRLMDLTAAIYENDRQYWHHRLDRLVFTLTPSWGTIRIGRQALTWGNGMIFNPLDVFNPFSPTDVARDYKTGDDMAVTTWMIPSGSEFQFAGVARRDPEDTDVTGDNASFAGKFHGMRGSMEFDILGAYHYGDYILGSGLTGYLKDAAWRMDACYTFLTGEESDTGFWAFVANLDYSWMWWNRNWHGLIEFYTNSLGETNPLEALGNNDLTVRLSRGELYTLGTAYLGTTVQIELHPLVNLHLTAITNLQDSSGVFQPRIIWDALGDIQITAGATRYWGNDNTEFGGFTLPFTDARIQPLDNIYVWMTYFF